MKYVMIDDEYIKFSVEYIEEQPFLHLELHQWSKSLYKVYLEMFDEIKQILKDMGYDAVWVLIPDDDNKLLKFEKMFGFNVMVHCTNMYLLYQEI